MSHEVETMAFAGALPWHRLGTEIPLGMTAMEALGPAGLLWEVALQKMYINSGTHGVPQEVPGFRAVRRVTDKKIFTVVGSRFTAIQNTMQAELADALVDTGAKCVSLGALRGGGTVWILMELPGSLTVPGDTSEVKKYFLLVNSHDGTGSMMVLETPTRVVCMNTLNYALRCAEGTAQIRIRHTASAIDRMKEAARAMSATEDYYARFEELSAALATAKFTDQMMDQLVEELVPAPKAKAEAAVPVPNNILAATAEPGSVWVPDEAESLVTQIADGYVPLVGETAGRTTVEVPTATAEKREEITSLFSTGSGIESGIRGTAWAAVNAVAEYTDHYRKVRATNGDEADARAHGALLGAGAAMKQKALNSIMNMVGLN